MQPNHSTTAGRVVLVTPARNEERFIQRTIDSVVEQTHRPIRWIIVDDGSTDDTASMARRAASRHPWISVVSRGDRGHRRLGGGVIEAFNHGLAQVDEPWDFVAKMDADLAFRPRYLELLLERFQDDPRLGSASGKVFRSEGGHDVEEFMIDEMVAGQFKLYRRGCFEAIGGFVPEVMWDGIDFHTARQRGWRTRSFYEPELRLLHLRLMGSSDRSVLRGRLRWGRGQWFMGSHPLYALASAALRTREKPYAVGGLLIAAGYLGAMLRRTPRYADVSFRQELQRWQLARIRRLLLQGQVR